LPATACASVCGDAAGVSRRTVVTTRERGRRGGCARRGATTSICGSAVTPFPEGVDVCDRAALLQSISEAAAETANTGFASTDIVSILLRPQQDSSSTKLAALGRRNMTDRFRLIPV
jgi:hypothetical protein